MKLVREYVACMDELSQIYSISEQKIEYLRKLNVDCEGSGNTDQQLLKRDSGI